jgi:mRNA interferase HicA
MKGRDFVKKIKVLGRRKGITVEYDSSRGKGSHGRISYGNKGTTIKDLSKELGVGLIHAMLKQLGIDPSDF